MSNNKTKKIWSRLGLFINLLFVIGGVGVSVVAMRDNNLKMITLYKNVQSADESGVDAYGPLKLLQSYVASHMNSTPPKLGSNPSIQLKNTYERAVKAETERVAAERVRIYNEAVSNCEAAFPRSVTDRAKCIIDHDASQTVVQKTIVSDLYRYDLLSPTWSPDLAGWSALAAAGFILLLALQLIARIVSRMLLK